MRWPETDRSGRPAAPSLWDSIAATIAAWVESEKLESRDAILLLPFASLLPLARAAFAVRGGWMPRIETTETLAASLGPAPRATDAPSFDTTQDRLVAARLLRSQGEGLAWERRDRRGFERAVRLVVGTAQALLRAAAAVPPEVRDAHWQQARDTVVPAAGPGGVERMLARLALEWAASAPPPATDRLFDLRPSAWIGVRAGGAEALADRLLAHTAAPALLVDTDPDDAAPFAEVDVSTPPTLAVCDAFEDEAQATAAQVVEHLRRGEAPVALIAQDRVLVRRVRALLERHAVMVHDETGWRLSTTRAAALVMGLLRAARAEASSDALLDWLKSLPNRDAGFATSLEAFERRLRRHALADAGATARHFAASAGADTADSRDARLWASMTSVRERLAGTARRPLSDWLGALRQALVDCESWSALAEDDAGRQLVAVLRLDAVPSTDAAWHGTSLSIAGFTDWVDGVLESETFRPASPQRSAPEVVVTPLARAMLRPFAAIVLPGADDNHLGAPAPAETLLDEAQVRALGVPDAASRRRAELLAFAQLLRGGALTLLRRCADGSGPVAASPLVARLALALARQGTALGAWRDPRTPQHIEPAPVEPTAARSVGALLPARLSATATEALRACPYRFFALRLLRLGEDKELDGEVEKRDFGNWLHALLHAFHAERLAPGDAADEVRRLHEIAETSRRAQGLAEADLLPFVASFHSLAPRYIAWLHKRDAAGWRWAAGEQEFVAELADFEGVALHGVVDRIDVGRVDGRSVTALIDYKSGSAQSLKDKVKKPLEDTQLAFYAALVGAAEPIEAAYLALDGSKKIETIAHPDPAASAAALRAGLAHDLQRIRAGAGLAALGAGDACAHCAARGVCRRDHWSQPVGPRE